MVVKKISNIRTLAIWVFFVSWFVAMAQQLTVSRDVSSILAATLVDSLIWAAIAVLAALLFNLICAMMGGIRVELEENN